MQCFLCAVKLDGWEATDSPLQEHLAHSHGCAWALCLSVSRQEGESEEIRDPMSEEMTAARRATFDAGEGWAHEGKKGWRCKTSKMVDAGWICDLSPDTEDGATCFYCNLSLDGWEPKDDPLHEHKRRSPDCQFFILRDRYEALEPKKAKGKGKGRGRGSSVSKASRQSAVSLAASEAPSMIESVDDTAGVDDSIMTTGTTTSQNGTKGKKTSGRQKAAPKAKGKKKTSTLEQEDGMDVQYPDLSTQMQSEEPAEEIRVSMGSQNVEDPAPSQPEKGTRKGSRQSKQVDSSAIDVSQTETQPKKRGRKPKVKAEPEAEIEPEPETYYEPERDQVVTPELQTEFNPRSSDVDAQLQEELDHSMDLPDAESTPQMKTKAKRGVKRSSNGAHKQSQEPDTSNVDFHPPKAAKGKKGSKSKAAAATEESQVEEPSESQLGNHSMLSDVEGPKAKGKKGTTKKGKGKKTSSTRSSKASATAAVPEPEPENDDLDRDEREIEAELARMADEQRAVEEKLLAEALEAERESAMELQRLADEERAAEEKLAEEARAAEAFQRAEEERVAEERRLVEEERIAEEERVAEEERLAEQESIAEEERAAEAERIAESERIAEAERLAEEERIAEEGRLAAEAVIQAEQEKEQEYEPSPSKTESRRSSRRSTRQSQSKIDVHEDEEDNGQASNATPSPAPSDKENQPSSVAPPSTAIKRSQPFLSPTKSTRVALAPSTPNRLRSPNKYLSPGKQKLQLTSSVPWEAADLDAVLFASPQATPNSLALQLANAAGELSEDERGMSVEEWVRWRAEKEADELRRKCEGMVLGFEKQGVRGLECLRGIGTIG